jgi:hypothetical protein
LVFSNPVVGAKAANDGVADLVAAE